MGNGCFDEVNPNNLVPKFCQVDGEIAGATADVQDGIGGRVVSKECSQGRLGTSNVPGRSFSIYSIEEGAWVGAKSAHQAFPLRSMGDTRITRQRSNHIVTGS